MNINLDMSRLFDISLSKDKTVTLVRTPLEFPGTNDNVVVRIRQSRYGYVVDDGGDTDWFVTTAGSSLDTSSVRVALQHANENFGIEVNDDSVLLQRVEKENVLPWAVMRIAQTAVSLFSVATCRQERTLSEFKAELKSVLWEAAKETGFTVEENREIKGLPGQSADYSLIKEATPLPVYVFAATDKARLCEAQLAFMSLRSLHSEAPVIAIAETQEKVGRKNFERAGYYTTKCLAYDKEAIPDLLNGLILN